MIHHYYWLIGCARSNAKKIDRNVQMKKDVVRNLEGPLERSTHKFHFQPEKSQIGEVQHWGIQERLKDIESHLHLNYGKLKIKFTVLFTLFLWNS